MAGHSPASGELLLGYDIGSSSVKAAILEASNGALVASAVSPDTELPISSPRPGWAEQHPDLWWEHLKRSTAMLREALGPGIERVRAIGLSYQMHGLVIVDRSLSVLRPSIIWCDSRAVAIGERAFVELGAERCLRELLNSPGNFTASKLRWVREQEPETFGRIHLAMLPGDYIAALLTGNPVTTVSGLSEGILWSFARAEPARFLLEHYGIDPSMLPPPVPTFSDQGKLTPWAAEQLGLPREARVTYRAGDQPNNAFSLRVLSPGEIAATAGTSGVVYGVTDLANYDPQSRVNTFVHVTNGPRAPRNGVLLCVNGTGILLSWLRRLLRAAPGAGVDYEAINRIASESPIGSDGLVVLPYGNGAERTLGNRDLGSSIRNLRFTRHGPPQLVRAAEEGVAFALRYGLDIMRSVGVKPETVRAGHANMFLSPVFCQAFAGASGARVQLYNTDGAQGAARGAGVGAGIYGAPEEAFAGLDCVRTIEPGDQERYEEAYLTWRGELEGALAAGR